MPVEIINKKCYFFTKTFLLLNCSFAQMIPNRRYLPSTSQLLAFSAVVRLGNLSKAADELCLTQGAVSRQIATLEQRLGIKLFNRVRKRIRITSAGKHYAVEVDRYIAGVANATRQVVAAADGDRVLNLAVLPTFGTRWLVPRLPRFLASNPGATVSVSTCLAPFDFETQPADMAIHFGQPRWPGARLHHLLDEEMIVVCSPEYQKMLKNRKCYDLTKATLLHQSTRPSAWDDWYAKVGGAHEDVSRGPRFEHFAMAVQAAVAGMGVALIPTLFVEDELKHRHLVRLFKESLKGHGAYYLVEPEHVENSAIAQAFKRWLAGQVGGFFQSLNKNTKSDDAP